MGLMVGLELCTRHALLIYTPCMLGAQRGALLLVRDHGRRVLAPHGAARRAQLAHLGRSRHGAAQLRLVTLDLHRHGLTTVTTMATSPLGYTHARTRTHARSHAPRTGLYTLAHTYRHTYLCQHAVEREAHLTQLCLARIERGVARPQLCHQLYSGLVQALVFGLEHCETVEPHVKLTLLAARL